MTSRKVKIILIALSLILLGGVAGVFIKNRYLSQDPQKLIASIQQNVSLSIRNIHQVSTRNGVKEWILDAKSAHVVDESKQLMLEDITVVYFLKDEQVVHLTAGRGTLKTETSDMEVTDHVVLKYSQYTLETEQMTYDHSHHTLTSSSAVKISGDTVNLSAGSMKYDINANQVWFQQNVGVIFRDNPVQQ